MQQTFFCPNCKAPVAYGQPYCTRCNTVLIWPASQIPAQYQSPDPNQQQWNQQQQSNQSSPVNQTVGMGYQGQNKQKSGDDGPGLLERIQEYKGTIAKIAIALVVIVVLIGVFTALQGEIAKLFSKPVVASFDATTAEIITGQSTTLQWNVTGVSSVSISPGIGTVPSSGIRTVSPDTTTKYTLVANNLFGSASGSKTITVREPAPSIGSFSFSTGSIFAGQSATLSWSVADATSVSISPEIGAVSLTGTKSVAPGATTTYTLTASNNAGNSTASATITVTASVLPIITTFSASPTSIKAGGSSTLIWDVSGSTSININQGIGGVGAKGSMQITPTATITYTLTAGAATRSVTVTVDTTNVKSTASSTIPTGVPKISTFSASPSAIMLGDNITLSWTVTGVKSVSISPNVGTFSSSGSVLVIPTATTTYTLLAVNNFGTENTTATVTVTADTEGTAPVIRSFTAAPSSISTGGMSSLTWDIVGATSIVIDQGIGDPPSHYSHVVSPSENTTYTLTAINSSGTASATVTVTIAP
jgi:hypothetical protein